MTNELISGTDYIGVSVSGLIVNNHKVLLLKRTTLPEPNTWSTPGGKIEMFETAEAALIREIKEELNITVGVVNLLSILNYILHKKKQHWVSICFLVNILQGTPENMEKDKHSDMKWFALNNLPKDIIRPTRHALENYMNTRYC